MNVADLNLNGEPLEILSTIPFRSGNKASIRGGGAPINPLLFYFIGLLTLVL